MDEQNEAEESRPAEGLLKGLTGNANEMSCRFLLPAIFVLVACLE